MQNEEFNTIFSFLPGSSCQLGSAISQTSRRAFVAVCDTNMILIICDEKNKERSTQNPYKIYETCVCEHVSLYTRPSHFISSFKFHLWASTSARPKWLGPLGSASSLRSNPGPWQQQRQGFLLDLVHRNSQNTWIVTKGTQKYEQLIGTKKN